MVNDEKILTGSLLFASLFLIWYNFSTNQILVLKIILFIFLCLSIYYFITGIEEKK